MLNWYPGLFKFCCANVCGAREECHVALEFSYETFSKLEFVE